jgi:hypothetical protein
LFYKYEQSLRQEYHIIIIIIIIRINVRIAATW